MTCSNQRIQATAAHGIRLRIQARRELHRGHGRVAVEILRVAAVLRPKDADVWADLAAALEAVGDRRGSASSAKIATALREIVK
jgi:Flp pilus assembly protein TadD